MSRTAPVPEEQYNQIFQALGKLIEGIAPWLVDFGSWLFGGLIAFNLLIVAALITVGPVEPAITVSTIAFALALPLEVAGLFLLRLVQDLKQVGFEKEVAQAFQEVHFTTGEQVASPTILEVWQKRRTRVVLGYCLGILLLNVLLTLTGMTAALWHIAWWVGVVFIAMVLISSGIVITVIVTSQPPDSAEEKERKRRAREETIRQAKERNQRK